MKIFYAAALALAFASPASGQAPNPHAQHQMPAAQGQQHGQHHAQHHQAGQGHPDAAKHAQHSAAQHAQHSAAEHAQHQTGQLAAGHHAKGCADANGNGRMDCCEGDQAGQHPGCAKHQAPSAGAQPQDR